MKKKILSVVLILAMVLGLAACGGGDDKDAGEDAELTVGFIYIGLVNDNGFTQAQHAGTQAMEDHFNGKVKTLIVEGIDDQNKQDATKAATDLIDQGADVVVGCSFGFGEPLAELANSGDYDDIKFLHFSGYMKNDKNMDTYFGATEEPRYLTGIIAGEMTDNNKLGYVAAMENEEVVRGINAFTLGAQSVNKDVEVNVVYTGSWDDAAKEKEAAEALLSQGCDLITQHADSTAPQLAAAKEGKLSIGYNFDNSKVEGLEKSYLTSPIWHHEKYLIPTIESIMKDEWVPTKDGYYGTMKDGYMDIAPLTDNVDAETKAKVEEVQGKIMDGEFPIFVGPIKDNKGKVQVEEGKTLTTPEILKMNYLVEGVKTAE